MKADDLKVQRFVLDPKTTGDLRAKLKQDPQGGLKQAAQQFEGMLLQVMLKSMRDATPQDGMLDSEQTRFFTSIFDQQLAQNLSGKMGFAKLIEQQLGRQLSADSMKSAANAAQPAANTAALPGGGAERIRRSPRLSESPVLEGSASAGVSGAAAVSSGSEFVSRVWPHAVDAAQSTGVPAQFLVAQAALETGWGKSEIRARDGSPSYNLFGVKAGRSWQGASVEVPTTEYVNGVAQTVHEKFRVYSSYAESFNDYASLLRNNPRFSAVLGQQDGMDFARSLQQAGYATDPQYADKLGRIINGNTLRQALVG